MKIFISWSGDLSHKVAIILKDWLQDVIQSVDPYVSSEDIYKGSRWFTDIAGQLEDTDFGIVCLTSDNLAAPWILFESGALSKSIKKSRVCPFLIDLSPSDVVGPLSQFQFCKPSEEDMLKLVSEINLSQNNKILEDDKLQKAFHRCFPEFKEKYDKALKTPVRSHQSARSETDILEEILQLCRNISQTVQIPVGERLTPVDFKFSEKIISKHLLDEVERMAFREGVFTVESSVGKNIMKIVVLKGTLKNQTKNKLLEFARSQGYDLRIKEIDEVP